MIVAFALAGWPVYRLTRPATAEAVTLVTPTRARTPADESTELLQLEAVFAPPPDTFEIKCLDQTIFAGRGPQARFSTDLKTVFPPEGVDFVVQARWPAQSAETAPAAMRVTARFADGKQVEKTFWSGPDGTVADVFTIQK